MCCHLLLLHFQRCVCVYGETTLLIAEAKFKMVLVRRLNEKLVTCQSCAIMRGVVWFITMLGAFVDMNEPFARELDSWSDE